MTESQPTNSGVCVVLLPSKSYVAARPEVADHHLTVAFLGNYSDPELNTRQLLNFWKSFTREDRPKLQAQVAGESMFQTPDGWAYVDLIDAPYLPDFRTEIQAALERFDLPLSRVHGLLPHITRRYKISSEPQTVVHHGTKLRFALDRVALWAADSRFMKELS